MNGPPDIRQVRDAAGRRRFLDLPWRLYRGDPNWIPPLRASQARLFAARTAFFDRAEMALFLAERGGASVGRVAAILNRAHNVHCGDRTGFFGFFECDTADAEAARGLFRTAGLWLADRGMAVIRGPVNPSMNAECGILVQGFDEPPAVLMPYNPEGYGSLIEGAGFGKCKDLYAYQVTSGPLRPGTEARERMTRIATLLRRRHPGIRVRTLRMDSYREDILRFLEVFEEARRNNWGYVPSSPAEILETAAEFRRVVDPEIVLFAEVDGAPAGASLALPNINRALAKINGRLFPFGVFRFLRELKRISDIRVFGVATLEKYRHLGITALLLLETLERGLARGYNACEASWVLEDNLLSSRTIEHALRPVRNKTYRLYEKPIVSSSESAGRP